MMFTLFMEFCFPNQSILTTSGVLSSLVNVEQVDSGPTNVVRMKSVLFNKSVNLSLGIPTSGIIKLIYYMYHVHACIYGAVYT